MPKDGGHCDAGRTRLQRATGQRVLAEENRPERAVVVPRDLAAVCRVLQLWSDLGWWKAVTGGFTLLQGRYNCSQ